MASNKGAEHKPGGLLGLPAELRVQIYHNLSSGRAPVFAAAVEIRQFRTGDTAGSNDRLCLIALKQTCKLVQKEATPVLYGETTFRFMLQDYNDHWKFRNEEQVLPRFNLIKNVQLVHEAYLDYYPTTHVEALMRKLNEGEGLERMTLEFTIMCQRPDASEQQRIDDTKKIAKCGGELTVCMDFVIGPLW